MARTVRWAEVALRDVDDALEFIASDSRHYAASFALEIQEAAGSLSHFADRGRRVPELLRDNVREIFIRKYRLIFEVTEDTVFILAFIHGARDFRRAWTERQ